MNILNIFYENIIPEASLGKINSYFYYNIMFSTFLVEENTFIECKETNKDLFIPTLIIRNKKTFNNLLIEYVNKALKFYTNNDFCEEILDYKLYDDKDKICKEKTIIATLFSNATAEDFNDPINFLRKRINFLESISLNSYDLGYCEILKSNIEIKIEKDIIENETPFKVVIESSDDNDTYIFPSIKFGISDNKIYIYAIQSNKQESNELNKKLNRIFYKIGKGFNSDCSDESLKDITASFLISLNICLSFFRNLGYKDVIIPSILIERWNAKVKANINKSKKDNNYNKYETLHLMLQNNLTNKLIRTFLRLKMHYNNINITSYPGDLDNNLHVKISDENIYCNNYLLNETKDLVDDIFYKNKLL